MDLSAFDYAAAGAGALAAGVINAVAGGGTLVSFPMLVAIGIPTVQANVTNTVALCPGYLGGTYAQRRELADQRARMTAVAPAAIAGGLAGSLLLVVTPEKAFRSAVPFLVLLACFLLVVQDRLRALLRRRREQQGRRHDADHVGAPLVAAVFAASVYGGFFGAGLGIMLLAVLGLLIDDTLPRLNAVKQGLSFVINITAALFFVFSGKVEWRLAPVMAVAALVGGTIGGRIAGRMRPQVMRVAVVAFGVAVAVKFWL
ncbi:MAG: sulfite exporter TauE/SafE family protein [Acidimicrobiia bacterium]